MQTTGYKQQQKGKRKWLHHDYKVNDQVIIVENAYESNQRAKLSSHVWGPFEALHFHTNMNLHLCHSNHQEDISFRCEAPIIYMK